MDKIKSCSGGENIYKDIDHVEIVVRDLEKSVDFYTSVLDFEFSKLVDMEGEENRIEKLVYLKLGNTLLELISVKTPEEKSKKEWQIGYRAMAIEVKDMDTALEELPEDVDIIWGPRNMGDFKRTEIEDPNGLPIELREWKN